MAKRRTKRRRRPAANRQATTRVAAAGSIFTPLVDALAVGGLSIIVLGAYTVYALATGTPGEERINLGDLVIFQALLNWPHFMASYRLLYATPEVRDRHKFASYGVPLLLLALGAFAVFGADQPTAGVVFVREDITYALWLIAAFYLAWHYTGQAWGMVASFAHLSGIRMERTEQKMIRSGLRALLVWHVLWGVQDVPQYLGPLAPYLPQMQSMWAVVVVVTLGYGVAGFLRVARRTKRSIPAQMILPWAAAFVWYLALYVDPATFLLVQLSHSLQYLPFPMRVEANRQRARGKRDSRLHLAVYAMLLVFAGLAVFLLPDKLINHGHPGYTIALLIASIVNIHHYFTDGVAWKISSPEVRKDLFRHYTPARAQ